ncbi:hypothetical protein [Streptomyces canus]|uniref:hypothetical protein n=1 Tax=Streptomyces canus TaxID=58343 RepID=UPI0027889EA7|nr:hypothetical protein [Streptomyces canus]MDQ0767209.1 hypothetical protein [Streptomyces canus]
MEFRPVKRAPGAFQQSLAPTRSRRCAAGPAFGTETRPLSAVELGMGMYNSTYKVDWPARTDR